VPVVPLAAVFGLAWVAEHLVEVIAVSAACGILAVAVMVALMRWADRMDTRRAVTYAAMRRGVPTATAKPQVTQGTVPPAIEYHVHHHHYHADSREPARVIPGKVLP